MFGGNKTKRIFPQNEMFLLWPLSKAPRINSEVSSFSLHIQFKPYVFFAGKQFSRFFQVIFIDMHIAQEQGYRLQRQIYLPAHEI